MFKRGAHTTISSNGLQNELVIGRVGIFGNLGKKRQLTIWSRCPNEIPLQGRNYQRKGKGGQHGRWGQDLESRAHTVLHEAARVQILESLPSARSWNGPV